MMKVQVKLISWKWLYAAIPIILYSLSDRLSMPLFEQEYNVSANFWDYVLIPASHPYFILYYFFPLIVFVSTLYINNTFEYTMLIRLGSYRKWISKKLWELLFINIFFMAILIGSLLITSINTPFSMNWSDVGTMNVAGNDILYHLQLHFATPFIAALLQIVLFMFTLITIQLMLCILFTIYKKQSILHILNVLLFLWGTIGFKVLPSSMKWFSVVNYLSLFHGVLSFHSIIAPFGIIALTLLMLVFIANKIDLNHSSIKQYAIKKSPIFIYGLLCLMGIWLNTGKYANEGLSIWDIFIGTFMGTTNERFSLLSFTYYVVVFLGAVYLVQLLLQQHLSEMSFYTMIRYHFMNKWFLSWFPKILKSIILLLLALLAVTMFIAMLKGYSLTVPENVYQILYHFMVNGFLQLLFYVLLVILISFVTKDVLKSFITMLVLTIFMLPGFRIHNIIPMGLNSMGYLLESSSIYLTSAQLAAFVAAEIFILLFLLNKKDYTL